LLPSCGEPVARMWFRLNCHWKRMFFLFPTLLLGSLTFTVLFWDTINEIPDRWHLPFFNTEPVSSLNSPIDIFSVDPDLISPQHPINDLIAKADSEYEQLLGKKTTGLAQAAQAYRSRRGRHPPPSFDRWVALAEAHDCVIIEDMFDRIYDDLNPFWAIASDHIRADAAAIPNYIRIRNGKAYRSASKEPFMNSYFNLVQKITTLLPDLDIPINHMDEPRVLVSWDRVTEDMKILKSSLGRQDLAHAPLIDTFTTLPRSSATSNPASFVTQAPYWNLARQACPPDTEARTSEIDSDFSTPPVFPKTHPYGTYSGYVQNWTLSQDICYHPHLRNMHGTFVEPVSISTSVSLVPMFSGSKLLANNDILLPGAMYWSDKERFAASKHHIAWKNKRNEAFWRGTASGGRNRAENWTRFPRHRLVSMLNGTQVAMTLEASNKTGDHDHDGLPHNFPPPNNKLYPLVSTKLGLLHDWIRSFSNVAFYWLECFPSTRDYRCSYTGSWYRRGRPVSMQRMFLNKYLPDVDGNSFSGRFRAFLMSKSLPIKATIYTEWHDSRLIPWKHFVPMDNTFMDMWSILEFFFQHDDQADKIALEGREWADRVLREKDMLVYVYRLLLEYARINDPNREDMGFGQDLVSKAAA
jgi:Glycosyl transferase family 90